MWLGGRGGGRNRNKRKINLQNAEGLSEKDNST